MVTSVLLKFTHTIIPWRQCWFQTTPWLFEVLRKMLILPSNCVMRYQAHFTQYHAHCLVSEYHQLTTLQQRDLLYLVWL